MLNWSDIQQRYEELARELTSPSFDNTKRHQYQKEYSYLSSLLEKHAEIVQIQEQLQQLQQQARDNTDPELAQLFQEELTQIQQRLDSLNNELEALAFPPNPLDDRSVFLEIRAGTGGQEAALFAGDLTRMYTNYALKKNWRVSVVSVSQTELKGFREIVMHIEGKQVYGHLKHESGVHRVQRVPQTETSGRVHTSTATVAVLPEAEEVDVSINPSDLRIDTFRAGGAGGQHVNKTESAIRITHLPTGIVVSCQDDRSQHKNKAKGMKMLLSRLLAHQMEKHQQETSKMRREQVGTGERAEKVRTYNFPQNRVTDHTVEITLKSLDRFIEGNMDEVIEALRAREREQRKLSVTN